MNDSTTPQCGQVVRNEIYIIFFNIRYEVGWCHIIAYDKWLISLKCDEKYNGVRHKIYICFDYIRVITYYYGSKFGFLK